MRAFEIRYRPEHPQFMRALSAIHQTRCCDECTYPGVPGICLTDHTCPCHDVELDDD